MTKRVIRPATITLSFKTEQEAAFATHVLELAFAQLKETHNRVMRVAPNYKQYSVRPSNWVVRARVGFDQPEHKPFDVEILTSQHEYVV